MQIWHWTERVCIEAEKKPIEVYTKQELFRLLKHFYLEKRKAKGDEFKPSTLKTIQRGLDWHLQEKNAGFSIIRDEEFTITNANKARDAEVNFLKMSGKGNKPNAAGIGFEHILLSQFVTFFVYSTQSKVIFHSSLFVPFVSVCWLVLFPLRATRCNA